MPEFNLENILTYYVNRKIVNKKNPARFLRTEILRLILPVLLRDYDRTAHNVVGSVYFYFKKKFPNQSSTIKCLIAIQAHEYYIALLKVEAKCSNQGPSIHGNDVSVISLIVKLHKAACPNL